MCLYTNKIFKSFENEKKRIKEKLQEISSCISFALDAWTSKNQISFLGISAHWISSNWELKNTILDLIETTNVLDHYIEKINYVTITEHNLERILHQCRKLPKNYITERSIGILKKQKRNC